MVCVASSPTRQVKMHCGACGFRGRLRFEGAAKVFAHSCGGAKNQKSPKAGRSRNRNRTDVTDMAEQLFGQCVLHEHSMLDGWMSDDKKQDNTKTTKTTAVAAHSTTPTNTTVCDTTNTQQ